MARFYSKANNKHLRFGKDKRESIWPELNVPVVFDAPKERSEHTQRDPNVTESADWIIAEIEQAGGHLGPVIAELNQALSLDDADFYTLTEIIEIIDERIDQRVSADYSAPYQMEITALRGLRRIAMSAQDNDVWQDHSISHEAATYFVKQIEQWRAAYKGDFIDDYTLEYKLAPLPEREKLLKQMPQNKIKAVPAPGKRKIILED